MHARARADRLQPVSPCCWMLLLGALSMAGCGSDPANPFPTQATSAPPAPASTTVPGPTAAEATTDDGSRFVGVDAPLGAIAVETPPLGPDGSVLHAGSGTDAAPPTLDVPARPPGPTAASLGMPPGAPLPTDPGPAAYEMPTLPDAPPVVAPAPEMVPTAEPPRAPFKLHAEPAATRPSDPPLESGSLPEPPVPSPRRR